MKELHLMDTYSIDVVAKGIANGDAKKEAELVEKMFTQQMGNICESSAWLFEQIIDKDFIDSLLDKDPARIEMDELVRQTSIVLFLNMEKVKEYDTVIGSVLALKISKYVSENKDTLGLAKPMFEILSDAGQLKQLMVFNGVKYADKVLNAATDTAEPKKADNKKRPKAEKKEKPKEKKVDPELLKVVNYDSIPKKLRIVIEKGFEDAKIKENILALASKAGKPLYYDAKASKDGLLVLKQVDEQANTYTLELPYTSKIEVETDKASA
mgnify:CR=1 FL=1|jgi:hypothetical protein